MMGLGIVEPIDDFRNDSKPSHPELLEHLTDEVLRLNFDLRELIRIIANTQTYQKLAMVHDPSSTDAWPRNEQRVFCAQWSPIQDRGRWQSH